MAARLPLQYHAAAPASDRRGVAIVLAPVLLGLLGMAVLAIGSLAVLSALRAYAGAGSQWSQARGQAVESLRDYARSRDPRDFQRFEQALQVVQGDRVAREELERDHPDLEKVRGGLVAGANDPADVDGLLMLYRRFGSLPSFKASLQAWRDGDRLLDQLKATAERMREQMSGPWPQAAALDAHLEQISRLNAELVNAERRFNAEVAEAARFVERLLSGSVLVSCVLFAALGAWVLRRTLHARARRERALAEAGERWSLAAEAGGLGLYDWTLPDGELRLDAKAAALYGLAVGHGLVVQRATLSALVHPDDLPATREAVDGAIRRGGLFKARYRIVRPDGEQRHLEVTGLIQTGASETVRRMVGVVRDVTDEELQVRLARERDAAERAARARMEFLSRLSHELRTPLNAILGFAQLLAIDDSRPLSGTQVQRVQLILEGGRQLLKLVEDVLDLTRIDAGSVGVALSPVDVSAVAHASTAMVAGVAQAHAVRLADQVSSAPIWAQADARRLQQVLINLLTNACKYNRPGGVVTVDAWSAEPWACVRVTDTGRGITQEEQAQLFQPFKRLPSTAGQVEGTGLGLFIVKSLVEHMHGRIDVDSVWGEGSRFTVWLPACAPA